ncbi:MAG TPA: integrase arm-type DNA-binding domain-containing protein [Caulobacteraceae bacterium]|jgi:integrase|nr:integrase arm-type DNA-binding domain-containing protein [Caulobacteraceae bacterium]
MARQAEKLEPRKLDKLIRETTATKLYGDGKGLYLRVAPGEPPHVSWVFRFMRDGQARTMGLGPYPEIGLGKARDRALDARRTLLEEQDPIEARRAARAARKAEKAKRVTFRQMADRYIAQNETTWTNPKHVSQWKATLALANDAFGDVPVADVTRKMVLDLLGPIWTTKTETASRLRGRIEKVLDYAKAHEYRDGENVARWKGNLDQALRAPGKVKPVAHHPALPYAKTPAFLEALKLESGIAAKALRVTILTALRTSEVIGATWREIDFEGKTWTVPADRMKVKTGQPHRVPLAEPVLTILRELHKVRSAKAGDDGYVFPGGKTGQPLSNMAMAVALKRMEPGWTDAKGEAITVHGFRSTFRDWAAETVDNSDDIAEYALAHKLEGKVKGAYQRSDLFERRRGLMDAWATFATRLPMKKAA